MELLSNRVSTINQESENNSQIFRGETEIQDWLANYLAQYLEITPNEIDINISFDCYGLDSAAAVGLSGDLEEWLGCEFEPTLLYDYPTIDSLTKYLLEEGILTK